MATTNGYHGNGDHAHDDDSDDDDDANYADSGGGHVENAPVRSHDLGRNKVRAHRAQIQSLR